MMPPSEPYPQRELLLRLRAAIDTARRYPGFDATEAVRALVDQHPQGLRSTHLKHNLGVQRWQWLESQGIYPTIRGTIKPDVIK